MIRSSLSGRKQAYLSVLHVLISPVCLNTDYVTQCMINSANIPLIKNNCVNTSDQNNYTGIVLSSVISNVLELL